MEKHLQTCLDEALKAGSQANQRLTAAARHPAWALLSEGPKGLLRMVLLQELPKSKDGDDSGGRASARAARRSGGGRRRAPGGRRQPREGLGQLPELEELVAEDGDSVAFTFAALLARTAFGEGDGDASINLRLDGLRETLQSDGVSSVWHRLGEQWPPIAELQRFPEAAAGASDITGPDAAWWSALRIDPASTEQLAAAMAPPYPFELGAEAQLELQRVHEHLGNQRTGHASEALARHAGSDALDRLEGDAAAYGLLLACGRGDDDAVSRLEAAAEAGSAELRALATDQAALQRLRQGDLSGWDADRTATGDDPLSLARRQEAWLACPPEAAALSVDDLSAGRDVLQVASEAGGGLAERAQRASGALDWWLVSALAREGDHATAAERLHDLLPSDVDELEVVRDLIAGGQVDDLTAWLIERLPRLDTAMHASLVDDERLPVELRTAAAIELDATEGDAWRARAEAILPLFTAANDPVRLSRALAVIDDGAHRYPYEMLIASHLHPAEADLDRIRWRSEARRDALEVLDDVTPPPSVTPLAVFLLKLLDGFAGDVAPMAEVIDQPGLLAFKQVRRAMADDGDGLVRDEKLATLEESIANAELSPLERDLLDMVVGTLRLSRAASLLQDHVDDQRDRAEDLIRALLDTPEPLGRFLGAVRQLVLEHDLGLLSLVEWYREHDPTHPWNLVVRAALDAREGDHLAAARNYRQAGDHRRVDFETAIILHRKALIEYARAARYGEAMELLEHQPALDGALTDSFRLFLKVSDLAHRAQNDAAVDALLAAVEVVDIIEDVDEEGEPIQKTQSRPSEERLELLYDYPVRLDYPLPEMPWQGRVTAALQRLRSVRRRRNWEIERDFGRAVEDRALEELQFLADDLATEQGQPRLALLMLERAQNAGTFRPRELKRINQAQRALFEVVQETIPVRERFAFRHLALPPLVLVDTNLLIDALREELARTLELDLDLALDFDGTRAVHRTLSMRQDDGKLRLRVPKAAEVELRRIAATPERLRNLFRDVYIEDARWREISTPERLDAMRDRVLSQFDRWKPSRGALPDADGGMPDWPSELVAELEEFLLQRHHIYEKLTPAKLARGGTDRSRVRGGQPIYPEPGDIQIMLEAAHLARQPLKQVGSVLVATRDGDFTLVSRALEERFGFGVASNAQLLSRWMH